MTPSAHEILEKFTEVDESPSRLCRWLLARDPSLGPTHLMGLLMTAFGVELSDVSALGGWWPEAEASELDDNAIDRLLGPRLKGRSKGSNL